MAYPDWVLKHKQKGTEIKENNGNFYLYERSTVWDKEKKQPRKISGKYLGKITPEGLIHAERRSLRIKPGCISVLECGASEYLLHISEDIQKNLRKHFEDDWERIYVLSILRTISPVPFKRVEDRYWRSILSERYTDLNLSGKAISTFLRKLGDRRNSITGFMKEFFQEYRHMIFDGTRITSFSEQTQKAQTGYNNNHQYDPQINLLYVFSCCEQPSPAFYRVLPGSIMDVSSLKLTIEEMDIEDIVVIGDKGFGSEDNFKSLSGLGIEYIIPLKRNTKKYDMDVLRRADKKNFDGAFMFHDRPIWHYSKTEGNMRIFIFLDSELKYREERDYMRRIQAGYEGYDYSGLIEKQLIFGTLVIQTTVSGTAQEIYELYKQRGMIEQSFDSLKNLLGQDHSYMQDDIAFEAWSFLNHVALMITYRIYVNLRNAKLLKKYSVADVMDYFSGITKLRINDNWTLAEIPKKSRILAEKLDFKIT